jgi:CBS domain containing-hemolysin-like protein
VNLDVILSNIFQIIGVICLVLANGFFVAAEFAFVRLRDTQLDGLVAKGHGRAKLSRHILQNLNNYLSATQLGITIASLGLGWIGEPVFTSLLEPLLRAVHIQSERVQHGISFAVGFSVLTFLQIVVGELGPKWFAIQKTLPAALNIARPLHWFYIAFYPINWALNHSAQWILRRVGLEPISEASVVHSEEELRVMLGERRAHASRLSREILMNALDLTRRIVRNVMRPRTEIVVLDTEATIEECLDVAEKTRYSRFPLADNGDPDKTLGVIHIKDLYAMRKKAQRGADLVPVARKLIYVPETTRLEKLLQLFLERKLHLAIVIDEYGGTTGLVSLENILEQLVGQIPDEFDQEKPLVIRRNETTWELDGALPLHELAELVGQNIPAEDIATTSGWVTQALGGFPKTGDVIPVGNYQLRIEETDGMRVSRLKLTRNPDANAQQNA